MISSYTIDKWIIYFHFDENKTIQELLVTMINFECLFIKISVLLILISIKQLALNLLNIPIM